MNDMGLAWSYRVVVWLCCLCCSAAAVAQCPVTWFVIDPATEQVKFRADGSWWGQNDTNTYNVSRTIGFYFEPHVDDSRPNNPSSTTPLANLYPAQYPFPMYKGQCNTTIVPISNNANATGYFQYGSNVNGKYKLHGVDATYGSQPGLGPITPQPGRSVATIWCWIRNGTIMFEQPPKDTGFPEFGNGLIEGDDNDKLIVQIYRKGERNGNGVDVKVTTSTGAVATGKAYNGTVTFEPIPAGFTVVSLSGTTTEYDGQITWSGSVSGYKGTGDFYLRISVSDTGAATQGEWGDGPAGGGGGDGFDDEDRGWLESLFLPSQESIDNMKRSMSDFVSWGPFGLISDFVTLSQTPASGGFRIPIGVRINPETGQMIFGVPDNVTWYQRPNWTYGVEDEELKIGNPFDFGGTIGSEPAWSWVPQEGMRWGGIIRWMLGAGVYLFFGVFLLKKLLPRMVI